MSRRRDDGYGWWSVLEAPEPVDDGGTVELIKAEVADRLAEALDRLDRDSATDPEYCGSPREAEGDEG